MSKKKYKLKKRALIITFIIVFVLGLSLLFLPYLFINIRLIGSDEITIDYSEKYSEPGYKASFFGNNITERVKVKDNIGKDIGTYFVYYKYNWLFLTKSIKRKIIVWDISPPKIELKGSNPYTMYVGDKYDELGYKATDEYDGDITKKVEIKNNIDASKAGKYEVTYKVSDSSGNKKEVKRTVNVEKRKVVLEITSDYMTNENSKGADLSQVVFVGDSNIMNMLSTGFLTGKQAWYLPCITSESYFNKKLHIGYSEELLLLDAVKKYKPKTMILNLGTFSTNWISTDVFLNKSNELIEKIKTTSPDTRLILSSLYPIRKGKNINDFEQKVIDTYNNYILEMAKKYNVSFLNVQSVLKASDGYAIDSYFLDDKFHFTNQGRKVFINYVKTHI